MDMRFLMKQAQAMQAKLAEAQANLRAEGTAGGGTVSVTLNGSRELQAIKIAKEAMDPEDPSMLEDLILAAFKDAETKVEAAMKSVTGTMGLPAGMNLPGMKL